MALGEVLPAHCNIAGMTIERVPNIDRRSLPARPTRRRPAHRSRILSGLLSLAGMATLGVGMATATSSTTTTTTHQSTKATAGTTQTAGAETAISNAAALNAAATSPVTSNAGTGWGATNGSASVPVAAHTSSQAS